MLSVAIPTYRKPARLRLTLRSLARAIDESGVDAEVIVVDDDGGSAMPVIDEHMRAHAAHPIRFDGLAHRGRSAARNRAASLARSERLLFLDDDMLIDGAALAVHASATQTVVRGTIVSLPWLVPFEDPEAGTLTETARRSLGENGGAALRARAFRDRTSLLARGRLTRFERDIHAVFATPPGGARWIGVTGAHFSVDRKLFDDIGGFDEAFGVEWGAEDLELGYRFAHRGVVIGHATGAVGLHMDHDQRGRDGHHARALDYFAHKHGDARVRRLADYFDERCELQEVLA